MGIGKLVNSMCVKLALSNFVAKGWNSSSFLHLFPQILSTFAIDDAE